MNTKDITANAKAKKRCSSYSKNVQSKMFSRRKPIRSSVDEKNMYNCLQPYYRSIMSSNILTYFCFAIYVAICLLGNVVTALIWLKHYQAGRNNQNDTIIKTHHKETSELHQDN